MTEQPEQEQQWVVMLKEAMAIVVRHEFASPFTNLKRGRYQDWYDRATVVLRDHQQAQARAIGATNRAILAQAAEAQTRVLDTQDVPEHIRLDPWWQDYRAQAQTRETLDAEVTRLKAEVQAWANSCADAETLARLAREIATQMREDDVKWPVYPYYRDWLARYDATGTAEPGGTT